MGFSASGVEAAGAVIRRPSFSKGGILTNRNLIITMTICQAITALCAIFVAFRVAQLSIDSYGSLSTGTNAYITNREPIEVRVIGGSVRVQQ
jgi:hypothetical protein